VKLLQLVVRAGLEPETSGASINYYRKSSIKSPPLPPPFISGSIERGLISNL